MERDIQLFIIKGLFENISYFRNVLLNLDPIYFDEEKGPIVNFFRKYYSKYEKIPDYSTVINVLTNNKKLHNELKNEIEDILKKVKKLDFDSDKEGKWLFDETRKFVDNRAMFLVLKEGALEISKEDDDVDYGKIEKKMRDALSMDWNDDLGIDFFDEEQMDEVYDVLMDASIKIPLGINKIDEAINGGIPGKTKFCMVYVGQSGLGKTLILSNAAVNAVKSGKNVLYITFEIDQKELKKRVDSTFTDYSIKNIVELRDRVKTKIMEAKKSNKIGRFIIKEFPPASVSALDIESFLHTLKLKKQFTPDIIILDYLGIMVPISPSDHKNSYEKGKAVCEEIRALSDRKKCPILSASQANRGGYNKSNIEMDNIADSMGIAHTADLIIGLSQTEELKANQQIKFEIIKSRISRDGIKGVIDIDYDKLKIVNNKEDEEANNNIKNGLKEIDKIKKEKIKEIT